MKEDLKIDGNDNIKWAAQGALIGGGAVALYVMSGVSTYIHEVGGHCLAGRMVYTYLPGKGPRWHIYLWDHWRDVVVSSDRLEAFKKMFSGGAAGAAWVHHGAPNALGTWMGPVWRSAFISLSGSLPELFIDSTLLTVGVEQRKRRPRLAGTFATFALISHLAHAAYPWSGFFSRNPSPGHDFAKFAKCLAQIFNKSPSTMAFATASVWTVSVPAVGLAAYRLSSAGKEG